MSKGWRNVYGSAARMMPEAANDETAKENAFLKRRLRAVATGVMTDADDKHLREQRTSSDFYQGGCKLSPGEMAVLHRMQDEGEL
jgi:hypothetical protein